MPPKRDSTCTCQIGAAHGFPRVYDYQQKNSDSHLFRVCRAAEKTVRAFPGATLADIWARQAGWNYRERVGGGSDGGGNFRIKLTCSMLNKHIIALGSVQCSGLMDQIRTSFCFNQLIVDQVTVITQQVLQLQMVIVLNGLKMLN